MRDLTNKEKIQEFMRSFGREARTESRVYFTGGVTAVLHGWRDTTIDIDLKFDPELDELFRAIPQIKEELKINVELAAPSDFIPPLPGWETRSQYIGREGKVSYYHYDLYGQALSKIRSATPIELRSIQDGSNESTCCRECAFQIGPCVPNFITELPAAVRA